MSSWVNEHIEWVLSFVSAAVVGLIGMVSHHLSRVRSLEARMDSVEEDLADAKSARTEQMRLMLSIQEQQQSMGVMLGRIDERTARDYPK